MSKSDLWSDPKDILRTLRWHAKRSSSVTASDVAAVLYAPPATLAKLYDSKRACTASVKRAFSMIGSCETSQLQSILDDEIELGRKQIFPIKWGVMKEPLARQQFLGDPLLFDDKTLRFVEPALWESIPTPYLVATPDGELYSRSEAAFGSDPTLFPLLKELVEFKCPIHHAKPPTVEYWWQMQTQMYCTGEKCREMTFCSYKFPYSKSPQWERFACRVPYSQYAMEHALPLLEYFWALMEWADQEDEPSKDFAREVAQSFEGERADLEHFSPHLLGPEIKKEFTHWYRADPDLPDPKPEMRVLRSPALDGATTSPTMIIETPGFKAEKKRKLAELLKTSSS